MSEVRVVNEQTGGEKGQKTARFDLLPPDVMWELAEHYGKGAAKYDDRNWELGYNYSLSFAALMRHAWAFWNGEDYDPDSGSHHMVAVMFHAAALVRFTRMYPELDDRSPGRVRDAADEQRLRNALAEALAEVEDREAYARYLEMKDQGLLFDADDWEEIC